MNQSQDSWLRCHGLSGCYQHDKIVMGLLKVQDRVVQPIQRLNYTQESLRALGNTDLGGPLSILQVVSLKYLFVGRLK